MLQVEVDVLKEEMTWNERSTEKNIGRGLG
jgi:hypothetical protein